MARRRSPQTAVSLGQVTPATAPTEASIIFTQNFGRRCIGTKARQSRKTLVTFVVITPFHSASMKSVMALRRLMPALLIRMCRRSPSRAVNAAGNNPQFDRILPFTSG